MAIIRQRIESAIATMSLVAAVMAYVPSAAAFTPAIFLSFLAAAGAISTAAFGCVRRAVITLLVVAATVLISPLSSGWVTISRIEFPMALLAGGIAAVAAVLFRDFRRRSVSN